MDIGDAAYPKIMLHYTAVRFALPSTDAGHVHDVEAAIELIGSVDWPNVMAAWSETQEGPLPAIVFQARAARAGLYVSHVPMDQSPYDQIHFHRTEKTGWLSSRQTMITAELHSRALLAECLGDWETGRWDSLAQNLRDQGVNVLG